MHQYIVETGNTVRSLLELVNHEDLLIKEHTAKLRKAIIEIKTHGWDLRANDLNDDFSDAYVMAAFFRLVNSTSGTDKLKSEITRFQALVGAHQMTTQSICGAILQIAKQGISLVHGSFLVPDGYIMGTPHGRMLTFLTLRDIIWQACSQAVHCKEGIYRQPVIDLFAELEKSHGPQFSLSQHPRQNRAKQIIQLLGWLDYRVYITDMQSLLL
ncbi:MAG: hypothetical protein KAI88_06960 [Nitrosomonadaceae bacterium]|nr:hypothetical protein [Nitrosomonadaceae bacterium]